MLEGLILLLHDPWAGEAQTPHLLRLSPAIIITLLFVGCPPGGIGFYHIISLPTDTCFITALFYSFHCRKPFLLIFASSSLTIAVYKQL